MTRISLLFILIAFAFSRENQKRLSPEEKDSWEARIATGGDYLLRAGSSGHKELVPALKKSFAESKAGDPDQQNARMALAKLGDREQQQAMVCDIYRASQLEMQQVALTEVSYVGGWYAIRIYRDLLTPAAETRFLKAKQLPKSSDMTLVEPRWWSLISLPKVVPSAPLGSVDSGFSASQIHDYSQKWTAWIQDHEDELEKLQPTGEGIDFSGKTCKSKSRKRSNH
jgi:hypothetical protein